MNRIRHFGNCTRNNQNFAISAWNPVLIRFFCLIMLKDICLSLNSAVFQSHCYSQIGNSVLCNLNQTLALIQDRRPWIEFLLWSEDCCSLASYCRLGWLSGVPYIWTWCCCKSFNNAHRQIHKITKREENRQSIPPDDVFKAILITSTKL